MIPLPNVLSFGGGDDGNTVSDERALLSIAPEVSRSFDEQMFVRGITNIKCNRN
jgi:hypothetical protein